MTHPYFRDQLEEMQNYKTFKDWRDFVMSTENRFGRFLSSDTIKRFMGMTTGNLNLLEAMDKGYIVLVNLGASEYLDEEAARVFASLLLNEFFETAKRRAQIAKERGEGKPKTFPLYLDEFQEYITGDIGPMLDQVRKGGLHMVLAHQHLGHLADNPKLRKSIFTNARIRAVFGGLDFEDASALANEMFLPDLNTRQIKKAYYHTTHVYEEQTRIVRSRSASRGSATARSEMVGGGSSSGFALSMGSGASSAMGFSGPGNAGSPNLVEGWFSQGEMISSTSSSTYSDADSDFSSEGFATSENESESEGETIVPVWVPIPVQELGSETEWSLEEKRSKVAEILKTQQQRHCFLRLDTEKTQPLLVPFVKQYVISRNYLLDYEQEVYQTQGALPAAHVDQLIIENEIKFLTQAKEYVDVTDSFDEPAAEQSTKKDSGEALPQKRTRRTKPQPKPKPGSNANNRNQNNTPTEDEV